MLAGAVLGNNWSIFPVALVALIGVAVYAVVRPKEPSGPYVASQDPATQGPGMPLPPQPATYYVPRRPRRSGMILFWPTLALLAIGIGSLAVYDLDNPVSHGAYPALGLAIIGAMLVIGAFVGRAGGLILLGLLTVPPLLVTSVVGNNLGEAADITHRPTTSAQVASDYEIGNGELVLDLRALAPAQLKALDGREIELDMNAGKITVILPANLGYSADAELKFAGDISIDDRRASGVNPTLTQNNRTAGQAAVNLDIEGVVGSIDIRHEGAPQ